MKLTRIWLSSFLISTALLGFSNPVKPIKSFQSHYENVLGTSFDLKVFTTSEIKADIATDIALNEIDRLSAISSSYDPNSELSLWLKTQQTPIKLSKDLYTLFELFDSWKQKTKGALNPSIALAIESWKDAQKSGMLPSANELSAMAFEMQQAQWVLDPVNQTATHIGSLPLVFNTFVKSYIIDKAATKALQETGVQGLVLNIGGDVVVKGSQPELIGVATSKQIADNEVPAIQVSIANKAIATSGNYKRGFLVNNKWYSHILDPRTAAPAQQIQNATVVANDATTAGALATAFNILSLDESITLASAIPGVAFMITDVKGEVRYNSAWKALVKPAELAKVTTPNQKTWNENYEVLINLELAKFEGRSHRPFVAIWVENDKQETQRTLALWFNKPRWLPDLKEWFRKNNARYRETPGADITTISSATRPAGNYVIKWDGKNDAGQFVSQGTYTIIIEVAREHGTYQIIKQTVECKKKEAKFALEANTEVASASVEYKKAS